MQSTEIYVEDVSNDGDTGDKLVFDMSVSPERRVKAI